MRRIVCFIAVMVFPTLPLFASPVALNLKDVPDDARATIVKELARKNRQQAQAGDPAEQAGGASSAKRDGGCNMDIGSQSQPSSPAQRRTVTVVVTGPVVQMCK